MKGILTLFAMDDQKNKNHQNTVQGSYSGDIQNNQNNQSNKNNHQNHPLQLLNAFLLP